MVELRKRKAPANPAPPPAAKKRSNPVKSAVDKAKAALTGKKAGASNGSSSPAVGSSIDLSAFGGEVETHDGDKTTLAKLVEESKAGVVLFTYPKASTPGCKYITLKHQCSDEMCPEVAILHIHISDGSKSSNADWIERHTTGLFVP